MKHLNAPTTPDGPIQWRSQDDEQATEYEREATDIDFTKDPGMTLQEPAEEADINVLMRRFGVKDGSILPHWKAPTELYGDFSELPQDPVVIAETLRIGELSFKTLPADIRQRFQDGPTLYNWLQDDKNRDEAINLGLLYKTPATKPVEVTVINPQNASDPNTK